MSRKVKALEDLFANATPTQSVPMLPRVLVSCHSKILFSVLFAQDDGVIFHFRLLGFAASHRAIDLRTDPRLTPADPAGRRRRTPTGCRRRALAPDHPDPRRTCMGLPSRRALLLLRARQERSSNGRGISTFCVKLKGRQTHRRRSAAAAAGTGAAP